MTTSPIRPQHQQEQGIAAGGQLARQGTPYGASLSFATTTYLRLPSDPPSREPRSANSRTGTARSTPGRALASSVLGSPCQGPRTGLPPPISNAMPGTPPVAPAAPGTAPFSGQNDAGEYGGLLSGQFVGRLTRTGLLGKMRRWGRPSWLGLESSGPTRQPPCDSPGWATFEPALSPASPRLPVQSSTEGRECHAVLWYRCSLGVLRGRGR